MAGYPDVLLLQKSEYMCTLDRFTKQLRIHISYTLGEFVQTVTGSQLEPQAPVGIDYNH